MKNGVVDEETILMILSFNLITTTKMSTLKLEEIWYLVFTG